MPIRRVGLINQSSKSIHFTTIQEVCHALQTQLDRDFTPEWGVHAHLLPFDKGEAIPSGVWPMRIVDHPVGGLGIHLDKSHKPYAQIKDTADWSITASHEMLEMLVDPYGHKFVAAPDIAPTSDGHLVNYLVEVGDPCEIFDYKIGGVHVSDFVTREYYNENASAGTVLDHLGRLSAPYEVPSGCYISWIDAADGHWHQKTPNGSFVRSKAKANPKINPRDDRDAAFGSEDEMGRHDLSRIRAAHAKK
jgi:hypothetical protein